MCYNFLNNENKVVYYVKIRKFVLFKMLEKFNRYKRRQRLTTAELKQKVQILSTSTIF